MARPFHTPVKRIALVACAAALAAALSLPAAAGAQDRPTINVKILGGNVAAPGQYPWMAALVGADEGSREGFFCGGTVIAPRVVLTAAHCTERMAPEEIDIVVGRTRMSREGRGERVNVTAIAIHPEWDTELYSNDVSLVQLDRPVAVPRIGLPRPEDAARALPGQRLTTSGWGVTREGGSRSNDLRYVRLTVRAPAACEARYQPYSDDTQLCAGSPRAGEDSCQGDSGGPLFSGEGAHARIHGIVSFGEGCGRAGTPGVYARVAGYTDWIAQTMTDLNEGAPLPPPPLDPPDVQIGAVRCGAVLCRVSLRVTGRDPAGGIVVNASRARTSRRKAVDRTVSARKVAPGRWTALINLPVGRVSLSALPLDPTRELPDGEGDVVRFVVGFA